MKGKALNWEDEEFCTFFMVKFCPHDLFVNTRADLGQCGKLHDEEAKRLFEQSKPTRKKIQYEDDFLRFCSNMINEVDRKIMKGKQRLLLMNSKLEGRPVSKQQEQVNTMTEKINKLLREAEEAGIRGDVDQAQSLMQMSDQLKEEKDELVKQAETNGWSVTAEIAAAQEKQMEVCEVCGAFLIVGDAQQRIDDHLTGKQHLGYSKLRQAVEEMEAKRHSPVKVEERRRDDDRKDRNGTTGSTAAVAVALETIIDDAITDETTGIAITSGTDGDAGAAMEVVDTKAANAIVITSVKLFQKSTISAIGAITHAGVSYHV
ncbi:conserved hypothetical protein [Culex quinquefasciatus]|uniref:Uncharacterized protein n=1 Tax=Culex quinquefasciatus TaxID=7176 RepID=B0WFY2_CULQU|nr:conserved hypothetical protein [Culex quinquefasciatus]|eukprot:XP_001847616.1 conserved hypothetical protein [Culex quinquefasciatus]